MDSPFRSRLPPYIRQDLAFSHDNSSFADALHPHRNIRYSVKQMLHPTFQPHLIVHSILVDATLVLMAAKRKRS